MDKSQKFAFMTLTRVLDRMLKISPTMSAQGLIFLSLVAANGEISMAEIQRLAPIGKAHVTRLSAQLGIHGEPGKPGMGLVLDREDPTNRSRKLVRLSPKGQKLIDELTGIMVQGIAPARKTA